ncbi:uncharacterized protein YjiS (DUF1127 family) [Ochrobactrum daejeonense]|uniref:Uncharacterized protein YjiS (DUF1127 family) n=1 Tax=Brucella daejeonensis TaxID=659015 RepID=A0A7W9AV52_9HYPH|nr:DUF1127 domain-containing protein [Brucella daejeonensis]MBB5701153.1 uncharacterized protein YjiS (DUF1127 family) [Brucella daejeonensis]NKB79712.1 DUF1127 domain-containing protein [Brucella daejeonensis]
MTATSKFTTTHLPAKSGQVSGFAQMVKAVITSALRRWALSGGRRQVMHLSEFDDHLLRDIGLRREDVYTAVHYRGHEDPTRVLGELADMRLRIKTTRNI